MINMIDLNGKSVIVVGSAATLNNSNLGELIDKFDVVIRANVGYTKGFEKDVGSKHTIWASWTPAGHYITMNPDSELPTRTEWKKQIENALTNEERNNILNQIKEIWYVGQPTVRRKWLTNKSTWKEDIKIDKVFGSPRTVRLQNPASLSMFIREYKYKVPSTGLAILWIVSKIVDKFYFTGFDCCGRLSNCTNSHYYWDKKIINVPQHPHLFDVEAKIVMDMVDKGKMIELKHGIDIEKSKSITQFEPRGCLHCGKITRKYFWEQDYCNQCGELNG